MRNWSWEPYASAPPDRSASFNEGDPPQTWTAFLSYPFTLADFCIPGKMAAAN